MTRRLGSIVVLGLAWCLSAATAQASGWTSVDVTLRDSEIDVVRSDGVPAYGGTSDSSGFIDAEQSGATTDPGDWFYFRPWGRRSFGVQISGIAGGARLTCSPNDSRVSFFSRLVPGWYDILAGGPGTSVVGDVGGRCFHKGKGATDYYLDYPSPELAPGSEPECVRMTRIGLDSFLLEAPPTCLADVYVLETVRGRLTPRQIASDVSLPFALTATVEPVKT